MSTYQGTARCERCEMSLDLIPNVAADEFRWSDGGDGVCPATARPPEASDENLAAIRAAMMDKKVKVPDEAAAFYSDTMARMSLLATGWDLPHLPMDVKHPPIIVPWCCDEPMHLRPSGWWCRVSHTLDSSIPVG